MPISTLLNPYRLGGATGGEIADLLLSQLGSISAPSGDDDAFRAWAGTHYQQGMAWTVLANKNVQLAIDVYTQENLEPVHVWWGDGTTTTVNAVSAGSGEPRTQLRKMDYGTAERRGVVILGNLSQFRSNFSYPNSDFDVRPNHLALTLNYLYLASYTQLNGRTLDLPRSLNFLTVFGALTGEFADLPLGLTTLHVGGTTSISGPVTDLPVNLEWLFLAGDSQVTGDFADLPRSMTHLSTISSMATTLAGDLADLPPNLDYLRVHEALAVTGDIADLPESLTHLTVGGTVTGDVVDLPPNLEHLDLRGENTVTGLLSDIPETVTHINLDGQNDVTGAAADVPPNLDSLDMGGLSVLTGDIGDLPDTIERLVLSGTGGHTVGGNISGLPTAVEYAYLSGNNTISGNLSGISGLTAITDLILYGNNTVTGDLTSLPDQIESLGFRGSSTVSGDLSDLPSALTDLDWIGVGTTATLTTPDLPTGLSRVYLNGVIADTDTDSVDNFLEAIWLNKDEPKPRSDRSVTIVAGSGADTPGPTSSTYIDLLTAYRSPNNDPQYLLWTVVTEEVFTPPVDVDVEIVNVGVSNLSVSNRTTHQYTYNFVSTTQDDTVVCLVLFLGDQGATSNVKTPVTTGLTKILESEHVDGGAWYGYYVPSQTDLNNGSIQFEITTSTLQVWQFVIMELKNADLSNLPTSMVADTLYSGSHDDRPNLSGGPLDVDKVGSLMVVSSTSDDTYEDHPTMSPDQGFTTVATYDGVAGMPGFHVAQKLATTTGSLSTPTFNLTVSDEQNIMGVVVRGISGEGEGGGGEEPTEGGEVTVLPGGDPSYVSGTTSIAKDLPAYEVGDALFAVIFHQSTLTPASGWELVAIQTNDSPTAVHFVSVYRKDMPDTTETTATWTQASSGRMGAGYVIARSNTGDVVVETVVASNSQVAGSPYEHPVPGVTTTVDGSVVLAISTCSNAPVSTLATYALPTDEEALGWVGLTPDQQLTGRIAIGVLPVETAGVVAGTAFEHTDVSAHHSAEIALVLAPSGDPQPAEAFFVLEAEDFV